jgi:quinol monooxygenase YgiN
LTAHPSLTAPGDGALSGVVVVLLVDFHPDHQSWGWRRLIRGGGVWREQAGASFAKVMGSGHDGGFTLRPSASHQGVLALVPNQASAHALLDSELAQAYRQRARQWWAGIMTIQSARGSWDGQNWLPSPAQSFAQPLTRRKMPLAVLTRASIRPAKAMAFWRHAPAAQSDLQGNNGCLLAMGLGEAPLVRQCTFSVWRDTQAMEDYAQDGAHQRAATAAYKNDFFSESLFVRLGLLSQRGVWRHPAPAHA